MVEMVKTHKHFKTTKLVYAGGSLLSSHTYISWSWCRKKLINSTNSLHRHTGCLFINDPPWISRVKIRISFSSLCHHGYDRGGQLLYLTEYRSTSIFSYEHEVTISKIGRTFYKYKVTTAKFFFRI